MEHTKIKCIIMIISHRLHHHHQYISCDNWTKGLTWFCPTCSAPVRTSTLKGQKWDQTIDNTDIVSKKHRCYIGKFPCVLIIQKKPELLQKTYFRSIFLLFLLLHSVGRVDAVIHVFFNYEGIHVDTAVGCLLICFTILCLIFFVIDRVGNCIIPSAAYHISCKITVKQLVKSQIQWCIAVSCGIVRCM